MRFRWKNTHTHTQIFMWIARSVLFISRHCPSAPRQILCTFLKPGSHSLVSREFIITLGYAITLQSYLSPHHVIDVFFPSWQILTRLRFWFFFPSSSTRFVCHQWRNSSFTDADCIPDSCTRRKKQIFRHSNETSHSSRATVTVRQGFHLRAQTILDSFELHQWDCIYL